jgi:hypothetical protein
MSSVTPLAGGYSAFCSAFAMAGRSEATPSRGRTHGLLWACTLPRARASFARLQIAGQLLPSFFKRHTNEPPKKCGLCCWLQHNAYGVCPPEGVQHCLVDRIKKIDPVAGVNRLANRWQAKLMLLSSTTKVSALKFKASSGCLPPSKTMYN